MHLWRYAIGLLVADGAFCITFLAIYWFQHFYSSLLAALVLIGALTYFPLVQYVYFCKYGKPQNAKWYNQYRVLPIFYAFGRVLFFFSIVLVVLVESAGMDVAHAIHHLQTIKLIGLLILFVLLMTVVIIALLLFYEHATKYITIEAGYKSDFIPKASLYRENSETFENINGELNTEKTSHKSTGQVLIPPESNRSPFASSPHSMVPHYQLKDSK